MNTSPSILKNRDFLVFSDDWGRHPFSCQHIMRHFLPGNRVLWVQTIGLRTPRLTLYDARRSVEKLRSWLAPKDTEQQAHLPENLHVVSPVMIPFNRIPGIRALNRANVVRTVRRAMRALGMHSPVLLATLPDAGDYAGCFDERLIVYYCVDDFTLWPQMNQPELVRDMENVLVSKADMVVAVSRALFDTRKSPHGPTYLLPHGVDPAHFDSPAEEPAPAELADITKPVVGFYGLIDTHFDVAMMEETVAASPDCSFVCVGTKRTSLADLERFPNFRWISAVPYARLPGIASRFDVAIIPYKINKHTRTANPLKLLEYIALGKPVVTTAMPEAMRFEPYIRIARDSASFIRAIRSALSDTTPPETRRAALQGETWADKATLLSCWIEKALAELPPRQGAHP